MPFPDQLFDQYKLAMVKFKKLQKSLFRRGSSPLADELGTVLAPQFDQSDLSEYAGACWIAAAKCEQDLENNVSAVDYLVRAGNAFARADERGRELFPGSHSQEHRTSAVRCYNEALSLLDADSALSAGIVRQLKRICPNAEKGSNFHSPTHRIEDLQTSAREHVRRGRHILALESLTEVFETLQEDKSTRGFEEILGEVEALLLLLLLLLELPPGRQSPIHVKILDKYLARDERESRPEDEQFLALQNLACACTELREGVAEARLGVLSNYSALRAVPEAHETLLRALALKFGPRLPDPVNGGA